MDDADDIARIAARLDRLGVPRDVGPGFRVSGYIGDKGAFPRCSADRRRSCTPKTSPS